MSTATSTRPDSLRLLNPPMASQCRRRVRGTTIIPVVWRYVVPLQSIPRMVRTHRSLIVVQAAIKRVLAFAPYSDMLWLETKLPDLEQARYFARKVRAQFPGKSVHTVHLCPYIYQGH